jgi:4a-hydroxytetrahydrobiopterin dehydratase
VAKLNEKTCQSSKDGILALSESDIEEMLVHIKDWSYKAERLCLNKVFKNHYQAMAFVNAVAWISHTENHHPSITVGYKDVHIEYWTHDIDGISENDFICAAKVNEL